jgi:hypothetical protein
MEKIYPGRWKLSCACEFVARFSIRDIYSYFRKSKMGAPSVVTASVEFAPDNVVTLPSNALSNPLALQSEIMSSFPDIEGISAGLDWFDVWVMIDSMRRPNAPPFF